MKSKKFIFLIFTCFVQYYIFVECLLADSHGNSSTKTTFYNTDGHGDAKAQYDHAIKLYKGEGGKKDLEGARKWYEKAANQGDAKA